MYFSRNTLDKIEDRLELMFHLNFHCTFTRFCEGIVQYIFKYYLQFMLCVSNKSDLSSEMSSPQLLHYYISEAQHSLISEHLISKRWQEKKNLFTEGNLV